MTKEEIINAVLNLNVTEIVDEAFYTVFSKSLPLYKDAILSICSKGVIVTYDNGNKTYDFSLTPFDKIRRITYLIEETLE